MTINDKNSIKMNEESLGAQILQKGTAKFFTEF